MYKYNSTVVGDFRVTVSNVNSGAVHLKRYRDTGVTPLTQGTLNLYIAGKFSISCPEIGLSQIMLPGNTNIDLGDIIFQKDAVVTETAIENNSVRICIQPLDAVPWTRTIAVLAAGESVTLPGDSIIAISAGSCTILEVTLAAGAVEHLSIAANILTAITDTDYLICSVQNPSA